VRTRRKFRVKRRKRWEDPKDFDARINEVALGYGSLVVG